MKPKKTAWDEARLQRLFERYNKRYWNAKLRSHSIRIEKLAGQEAYGQYRRKGRQILIDIDAIESDREIRSVFIHEMVHAATSSKHDPEFWGETERLLRQGAPITDTFFSIIASSAIDAGAAGFWDSRPEFPLCAQAMRRLAKRLEQEEDW